METTILDNIKDVLDCKTNKSLADILEVDKSQVTRWKQRGFNDSTERLLNQLLSRIERKIKVKLNYGRVLLAKNRLIKRTYNEDILIIDLRREAHCPLERLKGLILEKVEEGKAVLIPGDWLRATEEEREEAIVLKGRRYLKVRFTEDGTI